MLETKFQEINDRQGMVYIPSTLKKILDWNKGDKLVLELNTVDKTLTIKKLE